LTAEYSSSSCGSRKVENLASLSFLPAMRSEAASGLMWRVFSRRSLSSGSGFFVSRKGRVASTSKSPSPPSAIIGPSGPSMSVSIAIRSFMAPLLRP